MIGNHVVVATSHDLEAARESRLLLVSCMAGNGVFQRDSGLVPRDGVYRCACAVYSAPVLNAVAANELEVCRTLSQIIGTEQKLIDRETPLPLGSKRLAMLVRRAWAKSIAAEEIFGS